MLDFEPPKKHVYRTHTTQPNGSSVYKLTKEYNDVSYVMIGYVEVYKLVL